MIDFPIDFVVPYVNNYEPVWRENYKSYCIKSNARNRPSAIEGERYRDFGYLVYLFRGLEMYMPFIRKVFLIVSNIEQVPKWIDQDKVNIVLHKDFIPEQYLPTYNSTTIEMFLPDIPGLADHFIYGNDDIYTIGLTKPEDYFTEEGNPKVSFIWAKPKPEAAQYWKVCHKMYYDLVTGMGKTVGENDNFLVPDHSLTPINKLQALEARDILKDKIPNTISNFRTNTNYNQYIYSEYSYLIGATEFKGSHRVVKYIALDKKQINTVILSISDNKIQELILNDTEQTDFAYWHIMKHRIIKSFLQRFPVQSKYEKIDGAAR